MKKTLIAITIFVLFAVGFILMNPECTKDGKYDVGKSLRNDTIETVKEADKINDSSSSNKDNLDIISDTSNINKKDSIDISKAECSRKFYEDFNAYQDTTFDDVLNNTDYYMNKNVVFSNLTVVLKNENNTSIQCEDENGCYFVFNYDNSKYDNIFMIGEVISVDMKITEIKHSTETGDYAVCGESNFAIAADMQYHMLKTYIALDNARLSNYVLRPFKIDYNDTQGHSFKVYDSTNGEYIGIIYTDDYDSYWCDSDNLPGDPVL